MLLEITHQFPGSQSQGFEGVGLLHAPDEFSPASLKEYPGLHQSEGCPSPFG